MGLLSDEIAMALDRARLIAELEAGTAELREADRRKNEFLAMLAHELRNPIAPILNALQLMRLQSEKAPIVDRALCAAERQATHLVRMVDDLLDISRITRGKLQLRQDRFQLADMIEQGVQAAENLVRSKSHELVLKLPAAPVFVFADPTRLEQIVANLLNNAARYTPAGGKIEVACHVEGRDVVIEVADNGVGIAPDMLERIFDTFVQVGAEPRGLEGGLGLGLTLVRNLSELHGGSAHAESQGPSSGTRFIVRLPIVVGPDRSDA
jgi:signal transduction histidine kinase